MLNHTSVMALVLGRHRQLLRDLLLVLKGTLMLCCGQWHEVPFRIRAILTFHRLATWGTYFSNVRD